MACCKDIGEHFWNGNFSEMGEDFRHPVVLLNENLPLENYAEGVGFMLTFANVTLFDTSQGLVIVDSGSSPTGKIISDQIQNWKKGKTVNTCIYTHGHIDHCMGIKVIEKVQKKSGGPEIRVISHENVKARFDRYKKTEGYNTKINTRQFQTEMKWPIHYRYPDQTYSDSMILEIGGLRFELYHDKGETDDSTWVWVPEKKCICTGDLFIWASPNCGNPQKVQRYPVEWSTALKKMMALEAEFLFPGHGPPIVGKERVRQALSDTIQFLDSICNQTLAGINEGKSLNEILHTVHIDQELLKKPYLRPVYDDPMFIVHNLWRRYCGWWDFNPAHLRPVRDSVLAKEVCDLGGGVNTFINRAISLKDTNLDLAVQLIEFALKADPKNIKGHEGAIMIYGAKAEQEKNTMAIGIFTAARIDSEKKLDELNLRSKI